MTESQRVPESVPIPASLAGERVDRALSLLSGRSRAEVAGLIEAGAVFLDGRPVSSRHRKVSAGAHLAVTAPPTTLPKHDVAQCQAEELAVVYEDAELIVIDKPAGVVVHPGAGHESDTLVTALLARFPELKAVPAVRGWDPARPGIVHRLDKDTSGLLVVARTPDAREHLAAQLAARTMGRTYEVLALGVLQEGQGVIEAPIGRSSRDPTRMAVRQDGRPARTRYRVLERFEVPFAATFLEVRLETGRTHQIRVHLSAIGHPVAGDRRYGGARDALSLARPFLHARRLELSHPRTGERLELSSPLSPDLVAVLEALRAPRRLGATRP
jgi:23S rRNA pseudouridine1911/1915/1917 synthase